MPFTFAHPAAIVPLRGRLTVTSALVIGSMAPDFEYFLRGRLVSTFSHSPLGIVLFCLPLSLAVFIAARRLQRPFIALMPRMLAERLSPGTWRHSWGAVSASVVLGAITHIVWDSFTHRNGWSATRLGFHELTVAGFPLFRVFQHLSTLFGASIILIVVSRYLLRQPSREVPRDGLQWLRRSFWISAIAVPLAALALSVAADGRAGDAIVRAIDGLIIVTSLFAVLAMRDRPNLPA